MGYVYLIRATTQNGEVLHKIGCTKNSPKQRLKQLQTGCPYELELIVFYECNQYFAIEQTLHAHYQPYSLLNEWFQIPNHKLDEFITQCEISNNALSAFNLPIDDFF